MKLVSSTRLRWALRLAAVLAVSVISAACSPRIVEKVRTEYVYRDRVQVDTTFLKDSIFIEKYIRGDTVRILEYRDHLVYQYKMLRDTVAVHDTTAVETVREVQVEKPLSWAKRAKIAAFPWLLLAFLGLVLWTFRKFIF